MALSLKKNFGFALVGNLGYAASQYIILLIFIKLFSTEDVGQFIFAGAFTTPLMLALEMQLRSIYATDQKDRLSFSDYSTFRFLTALVGVLSLTLIAYFTKPQFLYAVVLVALIKSFESQLDLLYGVYQKHHQLNYVAYSRLVRGGVAIFVVAILSFIFQNILISLTGYLLSWFILYYFYERKEVVRRGFIDQNHMKLNFLSLKNFKYLLSLCAPVFFAIFVEKYYLNYPRLSVEHYFGIEALAIFGSLLYFKTIINQFISSMAQASVVHMAKFLDDKRFNEVNKLILKLVTVSSAICLSVTVLVYFFGEYILTILYNDVYAKYTDVLVVLLLGTTVTFSYLFIGTFLVCIRKQWLKLPISIISLAALYGFINLTSLNNLKDIALNILYAELISLAIYLCVYLYFYISFENSTKNDFTG